MALPQTPTINPSTQLKSVVVVDYYTRGFPATIHVFENGSCSRNEYGLPPLKFLADVLATEIRWRTNGFIGLGFDSLPPGLKNTNVQRVCFDATYDTFWGVGSGLDFPASDIQALLCFLHSLASKYASPARYTETWKIDDEFGEHWNIEECMLLRHSQLSELHQRIASTCSEHKRQVDVETVVHYRQRLMSTDNYPAYSSPEYSGSFTEAFVMAEYDSLQKALEVFGSGPAEIKLRADLEISSFVSPDAMMKEAHKKVVELGFRRDTSQKSIVYMGRFDMAPGKHANVRWEVYRQEVNVPAFIFVSLLDFFAQVVSLVSSCLGIMDNAPCDQALHAAQHVVDYYIRGFPATFYVFENGSCCVIEDALPLKFLAVVHATEIRWRTNDFIGFPNLPPKLKNTHVQRVCLDATFDNFSTSSSLKLSALDIHALLRFFPSLAHIEIRVSGTVRSSEVEEEDVQGQFSKLRTLHRHFASVCSGRNVAVETVVHYKHQTINDDDYPEGCFTEAFVKYEYDRLQKTIELFRRFAPAEIKLQTDLYVSGWYSTDAMMEEAHKKAITKAVELGFRCHYCCDTHKALVCRHRFDIAPGQNVYVRWDVVRWDQEDVMWVNGDGVEEKSTFATNYRRGYVDQ